MEPAKSFNNVIIGQFALTGVPVQVYVQGRFLIITDVEDVEDPNIGLGMDENGEMQQFDYRAVEQLSVSGNSVTIDAYNKGMGATEEEPAAEEEPKEDDKESDKLPKESIMNLQDLLKEISQDEVDAEQLAIDAMKKAGEAKIKSAKEKEKELKKKPIDDGYTAGVDDNGPALDIDRNIAAHGYTFGTGDIIKNTNPKCKHHGSIGVVKKIMDLPNDMGKVVLYTVTNSGPTYRPGDSLTKTIDQLEPIQAIGSEEEEY